VAPPNGSLVRGNSHLLGLYLRGLAMGIAEVVPGVSGGTIAFVSGIYQELIDTLAGLRPGGVMVLVREGPRAFWATHNLTFLFVLALGMGTGIVLFSQLLSTWLAIAKPVVWAFFFGVIGSSVLVLAWPRERRQLLFFMPPGLLLGIAVSQLEPMGTSTATWSYFFGGMIAVSAWLLPAVSGSFLLLVMGLYEGVLGALSELKWAILLSLAAGCALGLLAFANLLSWLLRRYQEQIISLLTGFMAGSLWRLWPWASDGMLSPEAYVAATDGSAWLVECGIAVCAGVLVVWLLSRLK